MIATGETKSTSSLIGNNPAQERGGSMIDHNEQPTGSKDSMASGTFGGGGTIEDSKQDDA